MNFRTFIHRFAEEVLNSRLPVKQEKRKPTVKIIIVILLVVVVTSVLALWWYTQHAPSNPARPVEYDRYSKSGLSFEYPRGMVLSEGGLMEATATDASGQVAGELKDDGYEYVTVGWIKSVVPLDLERLLESGFQRMEETALEGTSLERGELVQTTKSGHRMIYRYFNTALSRWKCIMVSSVFGSAMSVRDFACYSSCTAKKMSSQCTRDTWIPSFAMDDRWTLDRGGRLIVVGGS